MKKYILSLIILLLSWNSFSQNVTATVTKIDTNHVVLITEVARQVAVDLISLDILRAEMVVRDSLDILKDRRQEIADSTINVLEPRIRYQEGIIKEQETEIKEMEEDNKKLNKDLTSQKWISRGLGVLSGILAVAVVVATI